MRPQVRPLALGLLRSGLLVFGAYALFSGRGLVTRTMGFEVGAWAIAGYGWAALLLASEVARTFLPDPWARPAGAAAARLGLGNLAFGSLYGLRPLGEGLARSLDLSGGFGEGLTLFVAHTAGLAPWVAGYFVVTVAYRVAALVPVSSRLPALRARLDGDPGRPLVALRRGAIAVTVVFLILHQGGLVDLWSGGDFSLLERGLYLGIGLLVLAEWARWLSLGERTRVVGLLLSGAGWGFLGYVCLESLPLMADSLRGVPTLAGYVWSLAPLAVHAATLGSWLVGLILAITSYHIAEPYLLTKLEGSASAAPGEPSALMATEVQRHNVIRSPVGHIVRSAFLAATVYLVLHHRGFLHVVWGIDLSALQQPAYLFLALRLAGSLAGFFGRGLWRYPSQTGLHGIAWGVLSFTALWEIPRVLQSLAHGVRSASIGGFLGPYLGLVPPLAPWVLSSVVLLTAYNATAPYWNRPRFPWVYARLGRQQHAPAEAAVRAALSAGAIYLMLSPLGFVRLWSGLDLSFLAAPLYVAATVAFGASLVRILGTGRWSVGLAAFLDWTALAIVAYFLFHSLGRAGAEMATTPRLASIGESALPYLAALQRVDLWAASACGVYGLYRGSSVFWSQPHHVPVRPAVHASLFLLLAALAWGAFDSLRSLGPIYPGLGAVAFGALIAVAVGHLAHTALDHPSLLARTLAGWAAASPFRNANVGAFAALYPVFVRPALYDTFLYAGLLEWVGAILIALYVIRRTWANVTVNPTPQPVSPLWTFWAKHRQEVSAVPDPSLQRALQAQEDFISKGDRAPLLARLTTALGDNDVPAERIAAVMAPLMSFRDPQPDPFRRLMVQLLTMWRQRTVQASMRRRVAAVQSVHGLLRQVPLRIGYGMPAGDLSGDQLWKWAEDSFASGGPGTELVTAIGLEAWRSGAPRARIVLLISWVLDYRDPPVPWHTLPWARRSLADRKAMLRRQMARTSKELALPQQPSALAQTSEARSMTA